MKRLLILLFFAFVLWPHAGRATTCSVPNTFVNGTTADANQVNSNFSSLVSCGNAIDNTNIGSSGIYASQIKPTTGGQATFGGSIGYTINPNAAAQVPLTITNATSPSADYFDITANGGAKQFFVDSSGNTNVLNSLNLTATGANTVTSNTTGSAVAFVMNNNNGTPTTGDLIDVQKGGTNEVQILNGGAIIAASASSSNCILLGSSSHTSCNNVNAGSPIQFANADGANLSTFIGTNSAATISPGLTCNDLQVGHWDGTTATRDFCLDNLGNGSFTQMVAATKEGATQGTYLPPIYTSSGGAVASTLHGVLGTCAFSASTTCNVTLSGAAVFASSTSYSCSVSNTGNSVLFVAQSLATTSFQLSTQASTTTTATYACFGT